MTRASLAAALLFALLVSSGCGTIANLSIGSRQGWKNAKIYGGVRRDIQSGEDWFNANWTPSGQTDVQQDIGAVVGVGLVGLDVPLSAIGDTLTLPVTIPAAIWGSSTANVSRTSANSSPNPNPPPAK
jgi:uncharacterized protein YceK